MPRTILTKFRVRQGYDSDRRAITLDTGEIGFSIDTRRLFIGDGSTIGNIPCGSKLYQSAETSGPPADCMAGDFWFATDTRKLYVVKSSFPASAHGPLVSDMQQVSLGGVLGQSPYVSANSSNLITIVPNSIDGKAIDHTLTLSGLNWVGNRISLGINASQFSINSSNLLVLKPVSEILSGSQVMSIFDGSAIGNGLRVNNNTTLHANTIYPISIDSNNNISLNWDTGVFEQTNNSLSVIKNGVQGTLSYWNENVNTNIGNLVKISNDGSLVAAIPGTDYAPSVIQIQAGNGINSVTDTAASIVSIAGVNADVGIRGVIPIATETQTHAASVTGVAIQPAFLKLKWMPDSRTLSIAENVHLTPASAFNAIDIQTRRLEQTQHFAKNNNILIGNNLQGALSAISIGSIQNTGNVTNTISIGNNIVCDGGIILGNNVNVGGGNIAIGQIISPSAAGCVLIGSSNSDESSSVVIHGTSTSGNNNVAIKATMHSGEGDVAIGNDTEVYNVTPYTITTPTSSYSDVVSHTLVIGNSNSASGRNNIVYGYNNDVSGNDVVVLGREYQITGDNILELASIGIDYEDAYDEDDDGNPIISGGVVGYDESRIYRKTGIAGRSNGQLASTFPIQDFPFNLPTGNGLTAAGLEGEGELPENMSAIRSNTDKVLFLGANVNGTIIDYPLKPIPHDYNAPTGNIAIGYNKTSTAISGDVDVGYSSNGIRIVGNNTYKHLAYDVYQSNTNLTPISGSAALSAANQLAVGKIAARINSAGTQLIFMVNVGGTLKTASVALT